MRLSPTYKKAFLRKLLGCSVWNSETVPLTDAKSCIIRFSETYEELLKRKAVRKEHIVQYLGNINVDFSIKSDKTTLIGQVIAHWVRTQFPSTMLLLFYTNFNLVFQCSTDHRKLLSAATPQDSQPTPSAQGDTQPQVLPQTFNVTVNNFNFQTPSPQSSGPQSLAKTFTCTEFALQFSNWFYTMLNNCSSSDKPSDFGPTHFFPDCSLKHETVMGDHCERYQCNGADDACAKLRSFVEREGVLFNPHLDVGGCASLTNSFGMSVIRVSGTVHRHHQVVGVFIQQFGVLKDPAMQYNWRIKYTHLCVEAGQAVAPPSIEGHLAALLPPVSWHHLPSHQW